MCVYVQCIPRSERESQLYIVRDVSDASSQPVLFDPDLGNFMRNTFVMELEYMFVQVHVYMCWSKHGPCYVVFIHQHLLY